VRDTVDGDARPDGEDTSSASEATPDETQEAIDGAGGAQAEPSAGGPAAQVVPRPRYPAGTRPPPKAASAPPPPAPPPPGNPFRAKTKPGLPPEFYNSR
jgi:hypothetical protein